MTKGMRFTAAALCALLLIAGAGTPAYGFFPRGGFNQNLQLRYATWPFREFDTNDNGEIEPGEGLEFRIEGGPRGFSSQEIDLVKAGFKTWQDVPTSYAAFRFVGIIEDPIIPGSTDPPDFLPTVFMQVTEVAEDDGYSQLDPDEVLVQELSWFLPAITLIAYTIDITVVPVGGNAVIVPAGTILDCDIVVNASVHRAGVAPNSTFGTMDLQATITHQVGYLLGLSWTPLNNLDPFNGITLEDAELPLPVETAVLQFTSPDGRTRMMGATPTMFPVPFLTETSAGDYIYGWRDLAPDDISGVSWLYPREAGLESFFSIEHEARTHVREATGIPPAPIAGGHVVAWANITNSESDRRVPLFSTMSGLYRKYTDQQLSGKFNLIGLWKQLEIPGKAGELFEPSYVLTLNPLNGGGYDRQAPPDITPGIIDSLQGDFNVGILSRGADDYSTNYPSEVFNENGNVYGIDNNAAGTPLVWSYSKNKVVSKDSNKSLPRMLPRRNPMFGDPDKVCFMNIIENPEGAVVGGDTADAVPTTLALRRMNNKLRGFRDDVLLRSAMGTAAVDMYYRVAPWFAQHLLRHDWMIALIRGALAFMIAFWSPVSAMLLALLVAGCAVALRTVRGRRIRRLATIAGLVALAVGILIAPVAHGGQFPIRTEDLVAESTHIVSGTVVSAEGRYGAKGRIFTDVVFKIHDVAKGDLNRGSTVTFSILGGRVDTVVLTATGLPTFSQGERLLVYLREAPGYGLIPFGGYRAKMSVYIDPETEEEVVDVGSDPEDNAEGEGEGESTVEGEGEGETTTEKQFRAIPQKALREASAGRVPVREYMRYLRAIAQSQR